MESIVEMIHAAIMSYSATRSSCFGAFYKIPVTVQHLEFDVLAFLSEPHNKTGLMFCNRRHDEGSCSEFLIA